MEPGARRLARGQELAAYEVVAKNYAQESENEIHSDGVAAAFGFRGGLVPGVGDYAYMTQPVVEALGLEWLERGWMRAKFLKPVYDGERVKVTARVEGDDPAQIALELRNPEGTLCAVGGAGLGGGVSIDPADYPARPLPARGERRAASRASLPPGLILGAVEFEARLEAAASKAREDFGETLEIYRRAIHPALLLQAANDLLSRNVLLGPWIHTASEVRHFGLARDGERIQARGRVESSEEKRAGDAVTIDAGYFGEGERPIMRVRHSAIVRLARRGPAAQRREE